MKQLHAMDDEKVIRFCIYCPKSGLIESIRHKFCMNCRKLNKKKRFSTRKETTAEDLERTYKNEMVYCFICGEELTRVAAGHIMCIEGCGILDIKEGKCSNTTSIVMPHSKQYWPQGRQPWHRNSSCRMIYCRILHG